jgi:hypothetical protein
MTSTTARAVLIAASALVMGGCGSNTSTGTPTTGAARTTPKASAVAHPTPRAPAPSQRPHIDRPNRAGSYRLVGLPIVVREPAKNKVPAFGLYFRLNRSLGNGLLVDTIDDVHTDNLNGVGYDSSAPGHCYLTYALSVPNYLEIATARPGQVIPVTLAFHYPHTRGVLTAHVRLRNVRRDEETTIASPLRFHELGCR